MLALCDIRHQAVRDSLGELANLLTLRSHLEEVREWPFDTSVIVRFAVYLVIPLGSWAGAALVERLVNAFLG